MTNGASSEKGPSIGPTMADAVMVRADTSLMRHGAVVPERYWRPLFGREALQAQLWDKLKEGQSAVVKGSSALAMILGWHLVNPKTGEVITELAADMDILIDDEKVWERMQTIPGVERTVARTLEIDGTKVDLVSAEKSREQQRRALLEAREILLETRGDRVELAAEFIQQIDIQLRYLSGDCKNAGILAEGFFCQEAIGVEVTRVNGQLEFRVADPGHLLDDPAASLVRQAADFVEFQQASGVFQGIGFHTLNDASTQVLIADILHRFPEIRVKEILNLYDELAVGRGLVADCELGIRFLADLDSLGYAQWRCRNYKILYDLACRLNTKDDPIRVPTERLSSAAGRTVEDEEVVRQSIQEKFARAAYSAPERAWEMALLSLPLCRFVCPQLDGRFDEYHAGIRRRELPPSNVIMENLMASRGVDSRNVPDSIAVQNWMSVSVYRLSGREALETIARIYEIGEKYYKMMWIKMAGAEEAGTEPQPPVYYAGLANPPRSMSEVFALFFVAARVDPDDVGGLEIIHDTLRNWLPSGELEYSWERYQGGHFDMDVNEAEIVRMMRVFQRYDKDRGERDEGGRVGNVGVFEPARRIPVMASQ